MRNITTFILFLAVTLHGSLVAQDKKNGVISGRLFNSSTNEPVPFATLVIYGTTTGSISDLDGNFLFTGIQPGYVQVAASAVGFEDYISEKVLVTNANTAFIEIPMTESNIELDEVVVKASLYRKKEESPVSLQRIGIEQIEKNPGGNRDISKVIQSLPGVASGVSFRNDIIVRGGGPNENSFFLDGVEIPTINHFATQGASGGPVGIINVDFVREVNFYSGAFPAGYGNSLSSVIDMKQKDGNKEKLKFRGSVGSSDLALTLDGPLSDNSTFIFSVRRSYLQFLFAALELPFLPTYNDFQFKSRIRLDKKNELIFVGLGAIDQFKLNLDADETLEQRYLLSSLPVNEQWNYTLGAVYKHYRSNGYDNWVLSRNHLSNISYKYEDNDEARAKLLDYNSNEIETKFRYERTLNLKKKLKINFGAGGAFAEYDNRTKFRKFVGEQVAVIDYDTQVQMFHYSVFGQVSKPYLKNRLVLSAGLRSDASTYSTEMNNLLTHISPRFSASYLLFDGVYLNFNTGKYYQRPPYTAMGYKNSNEVLVNKENGLKYMGSFHYVAGVEFNPGEGARISLEGFVKNYSDYPLSVEDSIPLATKGADFGTFGDEELIPVSEGRAYGFEILGRAQDILGFNTILSYTYVRSEFKDIRKGREGKYLPSSWDNQHLLNLTGTRKFKKNWYLGFKWRFVGGAPYTPYDNSKSSIKEAWDISGGPYLDYSRFNELRFTAFHQLDIRIDKEYFFNRWSLNLYLDIQNIYNFKSEELDILARKSFEEPGYNDLIEGEGLGPDRYELVEIPSSGGGSVLPSVGIIVEF